ncbi:hypothetical protein M407DRAFT_71654 [Tulasnella calospora MUT 4182]|uniref:RlpA-like protein double-psi beta-barrel domain-containing protein n=1 Tax=Tulasnella calospora MUT 4182 TaxID=1051891 RepID=A0A0C3QLN5_9AGAM|nr:hypothetical protein M407DRAFT_71654 [Tulasnella calospora MUT 4182]
MKLSVLALFAAPALVLGALAPQDGPAAVARHHHNVARGVKAHPASHYKGKRGPAKARRCAAQTASLSSASVSSTSVLAEKTTTTTKKEEPTTTTTKKETTTQRTTTTTHHTTTTAKPKPTADSNNDGGDNNSGSGTTYTGDATFYSTGLNACGTYDSDSDYIAAVAHENFDSFPGANGNSNQNPICNKKVKACYKGNCVTVRITDRCGGCNWGALDFSPSAFKQLADPDLGRLHGMTWNFI